MKERTITLTLTPDAEQQTANYAVWVDAKPVASGAVFIEGSMFLHLEEQLKNNLLKVCQQIYAQAKTKKG